MKVYMICVLNYYNYFCNKFIYTNKPNIKSETLSCEYSSIRPSFRNKKDSNTAAVTCKECQNHIVPLTSSPS